MGSTAKIASVLLVVLFAAGLAVNAANASQMDLSMALADSGMAGCTDCGVDTDTGKSATGACDVVCVSSMMAAIAETAAPCPLTLVRLHGGLYTGPPGRTSRPEPYPPKPSILI